MIIERKLEEMGYPLPETPKPVAAYIPAVVAGEFVYTSGQIPVQNGEVKIKGKLGQDVMLEQGYEAARICAINALSAIKSVIHDLDRIDYIVKVVGFVNSSQDFTQQPAVINGASEFLKEVFAEKGAHARSAVGVAQLPLGAPVEVEMIVKLKA